MSKSRRTTDPTARRANAERVRALTESSLTELTEQLEAGNTARLDAYLTAMSRFHQYSVGNLMLILAQRPDATQVAGFHTWRSLGRAVKRGEKGILIVAPMVLRTQRAEDVPARGDDGGEQRPRLAFRAVHVFDVSQTEGDPLPEPARAGGDPGQALARLEAAVRAAGIALETRDNLGGAEGISVGGRIVLRAGLSTPERFATLAHEWAHEILHHRDGEERPPKTVRETEAEAVAYVVGRSVGLDVTAASSDYIRLYSGDGATLTASLDRIQKTAAHMIEAISREHKTPQTKGKTGATPRKACRERGSR